MSKIFVICAKVICVIFSPLLSFYHMSLNFVAVVYFTFFVWSFLTSVSITRNLTNCPGYLVRHLIYICPFDTLVV